MLERLKQRGHWVAERQISARRERLAARLSEVLPGIAATVEGEAVVLSGRGLMRRYDASAGLRWRIAEVCDER